MKKLALASMVAAAAAVAAPAQAVTVMAEDGWSLGVSGQVNQFFVYTEDNQNNTEYSEVRDGLLPAFLSFDMKGPEMNGLTMAAHISISPSTNTLAQQGGTFEQREVYGTVDGSFGQVLLGKALGLYGSNAILNEQTLFGVGWGTGANGTTTLGGIGIGYDYADWRSQIRYTTPDMNGFQAAFAVVDGQGPGFFLPGVGPVGPLAILSENLGTSGLADSENLRYEAQLTYAGAFDGGSFKLWAEGAWQDHDDKVAGSVLGGADIGDYPEDARYYALGGTLKVGGFEAAAQYSDAEDTVDNGVALIAGEWSNWFVQGGYRFGGTTLVSVAYAELEDDNATSDDTTDRITAGIYHDVNSNLKLVAEYTKIENDASTGVDQDIFALGGFVFF
jgi:predicted porin